MNDDRRRAFLVGEGTLTAREVHEWAQEMGERRTLGDHLAGTPMGADEPLMVSVVSRDHGGPHA